jgi:hypothetical protein
VVGGSWIERYVHCHGGHKVLTFWKPFGCPIRGVALCLRGGLLFACGRLEVGALWADPDDAFKVRPDTAPVFELAVRLGAEQPLSERVALSGYLDLLGVVTHAVLRLEDDLAGEADLVLWASSHYAAAIGVGVLAAF